MTLPALRSLADFDRFLDLRGRHYAVGWKVLSEG